MTVVSRGVEQLPFLNHLLINYHGYFNDIWNDPMTDIFEGLKHQEKTWVCLTVGTNPLVFLSFSLPQTCQKRGVNSIPKWEKRNHTKQNIKNAFALSI